MNAAIAPEVPRARVRAEVEALPDCQHLERNGNLRVYYAHAAQIPWTLQELGRLRELTFRAVGEGTGAPADLDLFDAYYLHLFVWDAKAEAIVGAYRLGLADEIIARYGERGLYTWSLFDYGRTVLDALNPAIELGRSFVRVEYQRDFAPLLLLWRGIAALVVRTPRYAVLFGAVSISSRYAQRSREVIVQYLSENHAATSLAEQIRPRRPFQRKWVPAAAGDTARIRNIDELSRLIADIERDGKGVPILLKQYLKCGGRLLGFSRDDRFGDALDGLIMVDLRKTDASILERYMGEGGAAAFLAYHAAHDLRRQSMP